MVGQGRAGGMKSIESLDLEFSFSMDVIGRCPPPTHVGQNAGLRSQYVLPGSNLMTQEWRVNGLPS